MNSSSIKTALAEILRQKQDDQEVAVDFSFSDEKNAQKFANLANQVVLDTTLNFEDGDDDVTKKMRRFLTPKISDLNIEANGNQVSALFSKDLIECLDRHANEMGINSIDSSALESWGIEWSKPDE